MIEPNQRIPSFNLWTQPWIIVELPNQAYVHLSIEQVLLKAHELRGLYDSSPLALVGIRRLLSSVLQDALNPQEQSDLRHIRRVGCFDEQAIHLFGEQYAHRFDLFSEQEPFLQSADLPQSPAKGDSIKTVAYLAPELPSGTAVTHFQHGDDDSHVFCASCAAKGLVTIPAFATSGGAGIKPSINGVPPLYVLPSGKNLFETLALCLILPAFQPQAKSPEDRPWWRRPAQVHRGEEILEVGFTQSLTFPARRVRLHPSQGPVACTRCGKKSDWGVRTMVFEMGECRPKESAAWLDPFAAYRIPSDKPPVPIRPSPGKAAWREYNSLFLRYSESDQKNQVKTERPRVIEQISAIQDFNEPRVNLRCIGMRTDMKAKIFEWVDSVFEIPVALLSKEDAWIDIEDCLQYATGCASVMTATFRSTLKESRYNRLRAVMLDSYWASLAILFRSLVLNFSEAYQYGQRVQQRRYQIKTDWAASVTEEGISAFSRAIDSIGDNARSLRQRVVGKNSCSAKLISRKNKEVSRYEPN